MSVTRRTEPCPDAVSVWLYGFVWFATLADQCLTWPPLGHAAGIAILGFLLLQFPRQRSYVRALFIGLSGIGLAGVVFSADPLGLFLEGWRRGAVYAAFFLALSSLRDAAETSRLVRRCGQHLVAQPPGRRYAALTGGGHLFGIILSYGAIELLGAMVMRAGGRSATENGRRMMMAIYRGFCVMNCWSPLNLMTAVVTTAVPAAPMQRLLPIAFVVSIVIAAIGWLEDRLTWRQTGVTTRTTERWTVHLRIVALVALVMLSAETISWLFGVGLVASVTLAVPSIALAWAVAQTGPRTPGWAIAVIRRRVARFMRRVPSFRGEATVLSCSGFMGVAAVGVLPVDGIAPWLTHMPPVLVPLLVPVLLILTGQIGLNPVAIVALLGAAMPDPARLGVPPAALAFACMIGWGLGVGMTPMSASAITTARWAGASPWTVGSAWNIRFTLAALVFAWAAITVVFVCFAGAAQTAVP